SGWKISCLRLTTTAQEPLPEILPGDALDSAGLQLRSTALELCYPGVFGLRVRLFETVQQPRSHLGTVGFIQRQSLSNDLFRKGLHDRILPCPPAHSGCTSVTTTRPLTGCTGPYRVTAADIYLAPTGSPRQPSRSAGLKGRSVRRSSLRYFWGAETFSACRSIASHPCFLRSTFHTPS